jgi:hypothetical protein
MHTVLLLIRGNSWVVDFITLLVNKWEQSKSVHRMVFNKMSSLYKMYLLYFCHVENIFVSYIYFENSNILKFFSGNNIISVEVANVC